MNSKQEVFVIVSFFPEPIDQGDSVRVIEFLRLLSMISRLFVVAVQRETTTDDDLFMLQDRLPGARVVSVYPDNAARPGVFATFRRQVRALWSGRPAWIANRYSSDVIQEVRRNIRPGAFLMLLGEASGAYAKSLFEIPNVKIHWDKMNVLSSSVQRELEDKRGTERIEPLLRLIASRRFERNTVGYVHSVSVTSDDERERASNLFPKVPITVIRSTVRIPQSATVISTSSKTLLWLGSFRYEANLRGLERFLSDGWPQLRKAGWTLDLVGSGEFRRSDFSQTQMRGVKVCGFIAKLDDVISQAGAAIVPVWQGAGIRMKTLTLMSYGLPTFGTPDAFEGITTSLFSDFVADSPSGLAERIMTSAAERRSEVGLLQQQIVTENFGENSLKRDLEELVNGSG